jgi:pyruvate-ferredoxin/flavodoxin oxidoreductase
VVSDAAPDFVKTVTAAMLAGLGDALPVSALPPDGTWPMGTTRWEKRNIAEEIPIWKEELCTQCNHCVAACPHSAIRAKVVSRRRWKGPPSLHSLDVKSRDMRGRNTFCRSRRKIAPAVISASKFVRQKTDRIRKSRPSI